VSPDGAKFVVLSQVEGESVIAAGGRDERLLPGASCLVPASLSGVTLVGEPGSALLKAYVPDLLADVIHPLRQRGVSDRDIVALGGATRLNDLLAAMSPARDAG
jgi:mannose-6-phosphate isomerase